MSDDAERMSRYMARCEWLRWIIAELGGYFWGPCPICHRMTSGFEWKDRNGLPSKIAMRGMKGRGICPVCTLEGKGDDFLLTDDGQKVYFVKDAGG